MWRLTGLVLVVLLFAPPPAEAVGPVVAQMTPIIVAWIKDTFNVSLWMTAPSEVTCVYDREPSAALVAGGNTTTTSGTNNSGFVILSNVPGGYAYFVHCQGHGLGADGELGPVATAGPVINWENEPLVSAFGSTVLVTLQAPRPPPSLPLLGVDVEVGELGEPALTASEVVVACAAGTAEACDYTFRYSLLGSKAEGAPCSAAGGPLGCIGGALVVSSLPTRDRPVRLRATTVTCSFRSAPGNAPLNAVNQLAEVDMVRPLGPGSVEDQRAALQAAPAVGSYAVLARTVSPVTLQSCSNYQWAVSCSVAAPETFGPFTQRPGLSGSLLLDGELGSFDQAGFSRQLAVLLDTEARLVTVDAVSAGSVVVNFTVGPNLPVCNDVPAGGAPEPVYFLGPRSGLAGADLLLSWEANYHYSAIRLVLDNAGEACYAAGAFEAADDEPLVNCGLGLSFRLPLTTALRECGFSGPTPVLGSAINDVYYETTALITTVEPLPGTVFGVALNRTNQAAQRLRLQLPGRVNLTAGPISVFPAFENLTSDQANFAAITTQTFNTTANRATVRLVTSAAWPYVLTLLPGSPLTGGPSGFTKSASEISAVATTCDASGAGQVCTQDWSLVFEANTATQCTLDGTYTVRFNVRCSLQFGNGDGCPALQNSVTSVVFDLRSDNFCARVIEVANVQPSLEVYASPALRETRGAGTQVTDATSASTLFYRFDLVPEAGLRVTSVALQEVVIVSGCSSCVAEVKPVAGGATSPSAASGYGWQVDAQTAGERVDFQFDLNENSMSFDNNDLSGQTTVSVFVSALVNYTSPDGQQAGSRLVRLQSSGAVGSAPTSASAQFGVGSSAAGPSTSSQATVLGLTPGTALVAGVGLVAVAALAVGAALAARRRSSQRNTQRAPDAPQTAAPAAELSLREIQAAYQA